MPTTQEILEQALVDLSQSPKTVKVDGQETTMPAIGEVLDAIKHVSAQANANQPAGGIRFGRISHGDALGRHRS